MKINKKDLNPPDTDFLKNSKTISSTECTGLMQNIPKSNDEEESYEDYDYSTGERVVLTRMIKVPVLKTINSPKELIDLATEFDFIISTYVKELVHKEELIVS